MRVDCAKKTAQLTKLIITPPESLFIQLGRRYIIGHPCTHPDRTQVSIKNFRISEKIKHPFRRLQFRPHAPKLDGGHDVLIIVLVSPTCDTSSHSQQLINLLG